MAEILIVDDERVLRDGLKAMLSGEGHSVRTARDGEDALKKISEGRPDLVLLDVMMPKMNGFKTCEEIRKADRTVPVIFLTAKDSEADQVRGLGLGADDYISKDAGEAVLLARISRALARAELCDATSAVLELGKAKINLDSLVVTCGRTRTALTKTEGDILRLLASEPGRYFTKDEIVGGLRGKGFACLDNMLYTHIHNLRSKLGTASDCLICDRHAGYKLAI